MSLWQIEGDPDPDKSWLKRNSGWLLFVALVVIVVGAFAFVAMR